ncbi:MAG TPA: cupin domain-containing protein [Rhodoferax sp.]|jgi:quercetin dioxygenase-like cupin family protein|nr:cupin domain-containing protein [Rhodoferax sp.]
MKPQAIPTVQIDNNRVIVTEWRFPPGAETGWHTHAHDYVVVPMTDGTLVLETDEGIKTSKLVKGISYTRNVGVSHNVINPGPGEVIFVEVEIR